MGKKVLLISIPFMSLYKDIIGELEKQGYDVTFMADTHMSHNSYDIIKGTPNRIGYYVQAKRHEKFWQRQVRNNPCDLFFDYLLVIDGFSLVNSGFIELLEKKNPNIKKVLYLFDKTYRNYCFDLNFKYFNKIYTFDIQDSEYYGINLLPIYWVPSQSRIETIDIFGFGTYMPNRFILFNYVDQLTKGTNLKKYIKIYVKGYSGTCVYKIRKVLGRLSYPVEIYKSPLVTHQTIPPSEFRKLLSESKVILDSHDVVQDGLTARFMWALGSGKKIITTNKAVQNYSFYDEKQIKIFEETNPNVLMDFLQSDYKIDEKKRIIVDQYRIDNWVKELLA